MTRVERTQYRRDLGIGALTLPEIDASIGRDALAVADATSRARSVAQDVREEGRRHLEELVADLSSSPELLPMLMAAIQQVPVINDPNSPVEQLRKLVGSGS